MGLLMKLVSQYLATSYNEFYVLEVAIDSFYYVFSDLFEIGLLTFEGNSSAVRNDSSVDLS